MHTCAGIGLGCPGIGLGCPGLPSPLCWVELDNCYGHHSAKMNPLVDAIIIKKPNQNDLICLLSLYTRLTALAVYVSRTRTRTFAGYVVGNHLIWTRVSAPTSACTRVSARHFDRIGVIPSPVHVHCNNKLVSCSYVAA